MSFLNDVGDAASSAISGIDNILGSTSHSPQDFEKDGFIVPPIPSADGNGLPAQKVRSQRRARAKRNMAHWFVPEVGVIPMYINPQSIVYDHKKMITKERTKGGWNLQYWGEELTSLRISGHTGSSGVEGLNVLYEIYRAEQFLFDPIALTMAADASTTGLNDLIDQALGNLGGIGDVLSDATSGLLGLDPVSQNILPRDTPSLATMAFGLELYYMGWVFRGYLNSMSITESVDRLGLFEYNMEMIVTQRRGYRFNYLPWHHTPLEGASNNGIGGPSLSFSGLETDGRT